jgi:hypothetical protein
MNQRSSWSASDKAYLERVHERTVKVVTGLRAQDYIGRLKELDILTLEERKHQADMQMLHKIMKGYGGLRSETSFESAANNALHVTQSATNAHNIRVKGTVSRDFFTLVFFIKQLLLVPLNMARQDFKFFRIFEELFEFVIDTPVYSLPGSRDSPVYSSPGS